MKVAVLCYNKLSRSDTAEQWGEKRPVQAFKGGS